MTQEKLIPSIDFISRMAGTGEFSGNRNNPVVLSKEMSLEDFEFARNNKNLAQVVADKHAVFGSLRDKILQDPDFTLPIVIAYHESGEFGKKRWGCLGNMILVHTERGEQIHATLSADNTETYFARQLIPVSSITKVAGGTNFEVVAFEAFNPIPKIEITGYKYDPINGSYHYKPYSDAAKARMTTECTDYNGWASSVKINDHGYSAEDLFDSIGMRVAGTDTTVPEDSTYVRLSGTYSLSTLELIFAFMMRSKAFVPLVGDWLQWQRGQFAYQEETDAACASLFYKEDPRHGISPQQAITYRKNIPSNLLVIQGMTVADGGSASIAHCESPAALQAVIVELTYFCKRRNVSPKYYFPEVAGPVTEVSDLSKFGHTAWSPPIVAATPGSVKPAARPIGCPVPDNGGNTYVLYHRDSDGRFAGYTAYLALSYLGDRLKFHEVQYGEPFPLDMSSLSEADSVIILDFSYKRELLQAIAATKCWLRVLDHHKSAMEELKGLDYALFDMSKSGALLAWEFFFKGEKVPLVCTYVNDRDLWTKIYPESRCLESYLRSARVGSDWRQWDHLTFDETYLNECIVKGKPLVVQEDSMINYVLKSNRACFGELPKYGKFALYNCPGILHSEVAEAYYTSFDVALTIAWLVIDKGATVRFSLRSPGRVDVSEIAKTYGGGGHAEAAGYSMPFDKGMQAIAALIKNASEYQMSNN